MCFHCFGQELSSLSCSIFACLTRKSMIDEDVDGYIYYSEINREETKCGYTRILHCLCNWEKRKVQFMLSSGNKNQRRNLHYIVSFVWDYLSSVQCKGYFKRVYPNARHALDDSILSKKQQSQIHKKSIVKALLLSHLLYSQIGNFVAYLENEASGESSAGL